MSSRGKHRARMSPLWVALGFALALGDLPAEPKDSALAEARASFQERRERVHHQMAVELEALARICSLDEQQRQRLEVAARGVAERLLEAQDRAPDPNKPMEWRLGPDGTSFARSSLLDHPLWQTTLREVLTRQQMTALDRERSLAKGFQRDAAIRFASSLLQAEVGLTEAQREKMAKLLERTMPDAFCEPELDAGAYTHWLELEDVEKILTKTQYAYWLDLQKSLAGAGERLLNR